MNYIELINFFWELDETWQFSCCETRLYFYLIKTANRLGWENSWTHSDDKTAANVGVSKNSFKTARNRLIQAGLIAIKEGGKGHAKKTRYQILTPKLEPKVYPKLTPKLYPKVDPLILNKQKLKLKEEKIEKKENHYKIIFDDFRKNYPGAKRGLDTEFENFKKKNSNYKEIVSLLTPALEKLIQWREFKADSGQFVPEWANLQTWINQKRWEMELEFENKENGNSKIRSNSEKNSVRSPNYEEDF